MLTSAQPLLFLKLALLTSCSSCLFPKQEDCEKHYVFSIPISIHPSRDTVRIGDTIWVESVVPDLVTNSLDGELVEISSLKLEYGIHIAIYDENSYATYGHSFVSLDEWGSVRFNGLFFDTKYHHGPDGARRFKVGLIPQKAPPKNSLVTVSFSHLRTEYEKSELLNKRCLDVIDFHYATNEGRDSSRYYWMPYESYRHEVSLEAFLKMGGYAFYVVE